MDSKLLASVITSMTDEYRVLLVELDEGSDQYEELHDRVEEEGYWNASTTVDDFGTLGHRIMDWYDSIVVSMDDAHDVSYDGNVLKDKHIVLEGVTPLRQPDHIDESYNTASRVDDVIRSLRRQEWQQYDGVGPEVASLLSDTRPHETDPAVVQERLAEEYGEAGHMISGNVEL